MTARESDEAVARLRRRQDVRQLERGDDRVQ
jgi:hypothetical protein